MSRASPRHGAMRQLLGARVGSAVAGAGAGRVEGGCGGWEVAGKLCASEEKERRASKHPQSWGVGMVLSVCSQLLGASHALEGSTLSPLTPAPLELRCRWALGCLGHAVVGLGQGHVAWQAVAAVGALRVLTGAALAQGLRATHLLAFVDVCKEEKDWGELVAQRAVPDHSQHLLVPLPPSQPSPTGAPCPLPAPPGCPLRPHQPPTPLSTSTETPQSPGVTSPAFGIPQHRRESLPAIYTR